MRHSLGRPSRSDFVQLPDADTFAVIGATVVDNFGLAMPEETIGTSILDKLV